MKRNKISNLLRRFLIGAALLLFLHTLHYLGTTNALPKTDDQKEPIVYIGNLKVQVVDTGTIGSLTLNTQRARKLEIKNDGDTSQFLRVMVLPVYKNDKGVQEELSFSTLVQDLDTTHWQAGNDGYYYYLEKLTGDKTTPALFSQIKVPASQSVGTLTLYVKVEAITAGGSQYRSAFWNLNTAPVDTTLQTIDGILDGLKE